MHNIFLLLLLPLCAAVLLNACTPAGDSIPNPDFTPARSYPPPDPKKIRSLCRLSLADAQRFALEHNPDYRSAFFSIQAASARYARAYSSYLPEISFRTSVEQTLEYNRNLKNPPSGISLRENNFDTPGSIRASLLLFNGLAREFSVLIAKREFEQARALDDNARRLLLRAAAYAYYDAILADAERTIALANRDFQRSSLKQAENRFSNGFVSKDAVLNFRILSAMARSAILSAEYRRDAARFALAALMGLTDEPLPPELPLDALAVPPAGSLRPLDTYLKEAYRKRPDLAARRLSLEIARFRKWSAYSEFLPTVRLNASYEFGTHESALGGAKFSNSYYNGNAFSYGLSADWVLFSGFSTVNRIRAEKAMEQFARFQLESEFVRVTEEVKRAFVNYDIARKQTAIYREMLQWVFEQRRLVASAYWAGNETITRLNGAQSDLVAAEARLAQSLAEFRKSEAELNAAVNAGTPEETLHAVNPPPEYPPLDAFLRALEAKFR